MALKLLGRLEKVNAAEKFGVDFFICGVLTETEFDLKIANNFAKNGPNPAQNHNSCAKLAQKMAFTLLRNAAQTAKSVHFSLKYSKIFL